MLHTAGAGIQRSPAPRMVRAIGTLCVVCALWRQPPTLLVLQLNSLLLGDPEGAFVSSGLSSISSYWRIMRDEHWLISGQAIASSSYPNLAKQGRSLDRVELREGGTGRNLRYKGT